MLEEFLLPELQCKGYNLKELWFQQDGAPWHRSKIVLDFLKSVFDHRVISLGTTFIWPPRSQDLAPMDYFFWDYMKLKLNFKHSKYDLQFQSGFREILAKEVVSASRKALQGAIYQIPERLEMCLMCNGGRFQNLLEESKAKSKKEMKDKADAIAEKEKNQGKEQAAIMPEASPVPTSSPAVSPMETTILDKVPPQTANNKSAVPPSRFMITTPPEERPSSSSQKSSNTPKQLKTAEKRQKSASNSKSAAAKKLKPEQVSAKSKRNKPSVPTLKPKLNPTLPRPPKPQPPPAQPSKPKRPPIQVNKKSQPQAALKEITPQVPQQTVFRSATPPPAKETLPPKQKQVKTTAAAAVPPPIQIPDRLDLGNPVVSSKFPDPVLPEMPELKSCVNSTVADAATTANLTEDLFNHNYSFGSTEKDTE